MALDQSWVSEIHQDLGSAFSLQAKEKVFSEQSPYQLVEVFDTVGFGKFMLIDGCTMVSTRDNFLYHEMLSHPTLFTHPNPKRVAIIGGGDCGTLREVLRHPEVEHCTQIDIDEVVTLASELHFPELCEANNDPRAELLFIDGIDWMQKAEPGSLDVIIVDATDPVGPGEVLFTEAFFAACHHALSEDGLIVQQSESPLMHTELIVEMHQRLRHAGFGNVQTLSFPQPIYPSGWWSASMACKGQHFQPFRESDVRNKSFTTRYYNAEIHQAALAQPEFLKNALTEGLADA